ncbi:hypothetical protein GLGCALEP_01714 [Pseudomonas sp. MM221]|nr:hypothetical protein DBADOPDK_01673 [Pseudomonas sp. MM223]CAI3797466.1 hypothetical protein GLGCALEP_01714 [Pseudomonas sp. MM221]
MQADSRRLSVSGAALGQFLSCSLTHFVRHGLATLFLLSDLDSGTSVALGNLLAVVGQFAMGCRCVTLLNHQPVLLAAGNLQ